MSTSVMDPEEDRPGTIITEPPPSVRDLTIEDRCDRCKAQAYYLVVKSLPGEELELLFCSHHGGKYSVTLVRDGWTIVDFTDRMETPIMQPNK